MADFQERIKNTVSRLESNEILSHRRIHGKTGFTTENGDYIPSLFEEASNQTKGYATLVALQAVPGAFVGQIARVTNDATAASNGAYRWSGTAWVKSAEDISLIKQTDLVIKAAVNLAKTSLILNDQYINSGGTVTSAAGWKYIKIPVTEGSTYTFGNFTILTSGYWSVLNSASNSVLSKGTYQTGTLPVTVTIPAGGAYLCFDLCRPTQAPTDYNKAMCNVGTTLLAYSEPVGTITKIGENKLEGSGGAAIPDNVAVQNAAATFTDLVANSLTAATLLANLPVGSGAAPAGVEIGQAWIDTAAGNAIKVKV